MLVRKRLRRRLALSLVLSLKVMSTGRHYELLRGESLAKPRALVYVSDFRSFLSLLRNVVKSTFVGDVNALFRALLGSSKENMLDQEWRGAWNLL
jgi:hypothetical protein